MKRVEGCADVKLMECVSPAKDKWRIRWDIQPQSDGSAIYMEAEFCHKPSEEEIRQTIVGWFNSQVDAAILSGFEWNGMKVWLSSENQFNYKAAYDLAVQTSGQTLPVTFKFGNEEPCYCEKLSRTCFDCWWEILTTSGHENSHISAHHLPINC